MLALLDHRTQASKHNTAHTPWLYHCIYPSLALELHENFTHLYKTLRVGCAAVGTSICRSFQHLTRNAMQMTDARFNSSGRKMLCPWGCVLLLPC